jgi:hypothetical protein
MGRSEVLNTITQLVIPRAESAEPEFRLAFTSSSPVAEVVLNQRGLFGNILIRGEDFCGRTKAVSRLCGDAAMAGFGVIYVTDGLNPSLAAPLKAKAREAFGVGKYHSPRIDAEQSSKFKVSRRGVSVLHFNGNTAPSSVDKVRLRLPGIISWITSSNFEPPLLLAMENFHLYCRDNAADTLDKVNRVNCRPADDHGNGPARRFGS